jgi:hypothetical protein
MFGVASLRGRRRMCLEPLGPSSRSGSGAVSTLPSPPAAPSWSSAAPPCGCASMRGWTACRRVSGDKQTRYFLAGGWSLAVSAAMRAQAACDSGARRSGRQDGGRKSRHFLRARKASSSQIRKAPTSLRMTTICCVPKQTTKTATAETHPRRRR